jgi:glycosyltransferase involved in cell wall biosynthesis
MSHSQASRISIIIPVYNEAAYLPACLESIARQTAQPDEVIIVDNNSSDGSAAIAASYPFARVITEPKQGIAFACYRGFNEATSEIIGRIDADTRLAPNWVEMVRATFKDQPGLPALTGRGSFYDIRAGKFWGKMQVLGYQKVQRVIGGTYFLWGANMAISKKAWKTVGDQCSGRPDIDDDIDLSLCLKAAGLAIQYEPALKVEASMLRGKQDPFSIGHYLSTWPKDYLVHRRYGGAAAVAIISFLAVILIIPIWLIGLCLPKPRPD